MQHSGKHHRGGIIHTYRRYDPQRFPSPTQPPPDVLSGAFDHLLAYGSLRRLTEEELARAVRLDPSQIGSLGPSIDALMQILLQRKRKILERYETDAALQAAADAYQAEARRVEPPRRLRKPLAEAIRDEQLRDLQQLWFRVGDDRSPVARRLVQLIERLGDKYQVEELAAKYEFRGRTPMDVPQALAIKEELQQIDRLLEQLKQAAETAQIAVIDMEALAEYAETEDIANLAAVAQQIQDFLREQAERQGLQRDHRGFQLTPKAYRLFQGRLLERLFSHLQASRAGRHEGPVTGEGAVELTTSRPYEFGDSVANMDIPATFLNALARRGPGLPVTVKPRDIEIHRTRNRPKCATCVLMDMSGSMRYAGLYVHVKRMGLALEGLIRREYPGDYLQFLEIYSFAKPRRASELVELLPKPVTITEPLVRLRADMSRDDIFEHQIPPHFTNIQHGLSLARKFLATQDTPNRQVILITDGLPTAHFDNAMLYLLYPPDPQTEAATLREGMLCLREGITINIFILPSWSQSEEDIRFAYRLAESTRGRVFFTSGHDLDRYVVWDYLSRRREIIG